MKKFVPFLILATIVVIFFRQFFLQNLLPIPADTIVGLYNPFRDLYAKDYPRGIPFKNFLITDPVRQQYPWRFESILQEKMMQLPLWNPYNFAGNPLLANQQSAGLSATNLLFFVLPFHTAWSLLIFLQPLLAGFFLFLYLKNLKLTLLPSLLGSIAFVFSGFFVAWLEWGTIDSVVLWLPLLLLSIDKVFTELSALEISNFKFQISNKIYKFQKYKIWFFVYLCSLVISFLAGHLQGFFYLFLIQLAYIILYLVSSKHKVKTVLLFVICYLLFVILTAIQWLPLLQFILLSARSTDLVIQAGWFIPYQHLLTFFVPDFFGNPTTLNYWGIWNYGELAGYVGIVPLFFAFFAVISNKSKNMLFFLGALLISLLFALPTFLAQLSLTFHIPFLATAQPTRLMILIDFSLCVLAAIGLNEFIQHQRRVYIPVGIFIVIFASIWTIVSLHATLLSMVTLTNILVAKHNLAFPTSIFAILLLFIFASIFLRKNQIIFMGCIICILALSSFDSIRFADKFTPFVSPAYLYPTTKTTAFLQSHIGNYRIMSTDSQILPPNFSIMYHIQSVDGYDPLYIKEYGELIAIMERNKPDIHDPFGFNRIITPHNYTSRLIDLLGVKYILSLTELSSPKLKKVFTEGQTKVYENLQAYPRAFFVQKLIEENSQQKIVDDMFNNSNNLRSTAIVLENLHQTQFATQHSNVSIHEYIGNTISVSTNNPSLGFLVLTDSDYPTWHAYIDGVETKIYATDLAFRGIFVPAGNHAVVFRDSLF